MCLDLDPVMHSYDHDPQQFLSIMDRDVSDNSGSMDWFPFLDRTFISQRLVNLRPADYRLDQMRVGCVLKKHPPLLLRAST